MKLQPQSDLREMLLAVLVIDEVERPSIQNIMETAILKKQALTSLIQDFLPPGSALTYKHQYKELKCFAEGGQGSAWLVVGITDNKKYVAKKTKVS